MWTGPSLLKDDMSHHEHLVEVQKESAHQLLKVYEETIAQPEQVNLGKVAQVAPLYHGETPPLALREYLVQYPPSLIKAHQLACAIYDDVFMEQVVEQHKIWDTDYQYALGTFAFQIDGPAYPAEFLEQAKWMPPEFLAQFILMRMFECEPNIAAYGLNHRLWPEGTTNQTWHSALEQLRIKTGKKIAVLAGSEQKLREMVLYELGVPFEQLPSPDEIKSITGFDAFLGPNDVLKLYQQCQGDSPYLFFGRTSMPKTWLKNPAEQNETSFLEQPEILRFVRAHAITHNFDDPKKSSGDPAVITDTKEPLVYIGAAHLVTAVTDVYSPVFLAMCAGLNITEQGIVEGTLTEKQKRNLATALLNNPVPELLSDALIAHLQKRGVDVKSAANGKQAFRVKPLKQHYGIYGHLTGELSKVSFLNKLMTQIQARGQYILQPEFKNLILDDPDLGQHLAIDRVFMVRGSDGLFHPMESCRSLMPLDTLEGKRNNVHEGPQTKCARITLE
jgi:hypothetical protein